jgi:putative ABC transport system permease protein
MRILSILRIALTAVVANKVRSMLTSLGVIIGVGSVIMLVSIGTGIQNYVTSAFQDLGTNLLFVQPGKISFSDSGREGGPPGVSTNKLTMSTSRDVARVSGVSDVVPILSTNIKASFGGKDIDTGVLGTTANYSTVRNTDVSKGEFIDNSDVSRAGKVAVIGPTIVKELFGGIDPIGKELVVGDKRYKVIGILESKGGGFGGDQDNAVIIPITTLQRQLDSDKLNYIYIQVADTTQIDRVTNDIEKLLLKDMDEDQFSVVNSQELLKTITGILGAITFGLGGIAAISLVVGGIGIMNIMLVSVTERTKEIGLRKAVGAKPQDILIQFLIEAIVLSVLGGAIGVLLGALGSALINNFVKTSVTFWSVAIAFLFALAVGVIFGVWPAWKASKLSPIEALRYE